MPPVGQDMLTFHEHLIPSYYSDSLGVHAMIAMYIPITLPRVVLGVTLLPRTLQGYVMSCGWSPDVAVLL